MGVLLVTVAIGLSVAVGIVAERRWPSAAAAAVRKAMTAILYLLLPPVIFFNLAAAQIDVDHGVGLVLALAAVAIAAIVVWWAASRLPSPRSRRATSTR